MPTDVLSALKRLESALRNRLARKSVSLKRRILVLVVTLVLPLAAYAASARWLLSGPRLRAIINTDPESLLLDYDEASSLWPGHVAIRNLRIRGSDQNVQWIIRLATARIDYSILALAQRTFRVERLRGEGLAFFVRNKLDPATVRLADASVLPPVPGFADPPLRSDPVQGPESEADPWRIDVRTLFIDHFDEIWVDAFHFRGGARLEGGFFLRPGLLAHIGPARIQVDGGKMTIGGSPATVSVLGTVSGTFEPFEPPLVHGSEVWQRVTGAVALDLRFERLESLQYLARPAADARFEDGAGRGTIRAAIEHGIANGEIRLAVQEGAVQLRELKLHGNADLRLLIPRWNLVSGPLEVSGSRLALSDVRSSGSDESRRWWGRFDVRSGTIGKTASAELRVATRDARPLLALFSTDLPAWTRGLVNLDNFTATATVDAGPSLTRVRDLDARGGSFHIQGHYMRRNTSREGAFLIESGVLSLGLELGQNATKIRLLGAKQWFDEQPDGNRAGRNATPPSDDAAVGQRAELQKRSAGRLLPAPKNRFAARFQFPRTLSHASWVASRASVHGSVAPGLLFQSRCSSDSTSSNLLPAYSSRPADSHPKR